MNLQQLEYIAAVDTHRHFARAAEHCHVTQATLSMMIKKLEEELKVTLFDRSKQPVVPTREGAKIIQQARLVIREAMTIKDLAEQSKSLFSGELNIGIIPTLAPYLLPLFIKSFIEEYPLIRLIVSELTTDQIIQNLAHGEIDCGLLATPLNASGLKEDVLFYEKFLLYGNPQNLKPNELPDSKSLNNENIWLLREGHCLRTQVSSICDVHKNSFFDKHLLFEAGSIESLIGLVDRYKGLTIVPELAAVQMDEKRKSNMHLFKEPAPAREISLVTFRHEMKSALIEALKTSIRDNVIPYLTEGAYKAIKTKLGG